MKVIDQDGKEQVWTAVFMRFYREQREECEDLDDALGLLFWGQERNDLNPVSVIHPGGHVLEGAELSAAVAEYGREE